MNTHNIHNRLIFAATCVVLTILTPAHGFPGGVPYDVERSGLVLLRGSEADCTAVAVTADLLLTARKCLGDAEAQNPEMIGWFMGKQDSDDNPVREVSFDAQSRFALLRLSKPVVINGRGISLYGGEDSALTDFRCYSFGPTRASVFSYGATLSFQDFHVTGMAAGGFITNPNPPIQPLDIGGACFRASTNELAAMYLSSDRTGMLVGIARARGWITEFRATLEVIAEHSGLCLGSVPNGALIWQSPCLPGDHPRRRDQQWNIRRYDPSSFQIRSTSYPRLCLGGPPSNSTGYAADAVLFSPCAPPLTNGSAPWNLPTTPRREQLWAIIPTDGDAVEVKNVFSGNCLDVPGDSRTLAVLYQSGCNQGGNQRFLINVDRFEGDRHRLVSFNTTQCADVPSGSLARGTPVQGYDCHGAENQQFQVLRDGTSHNQLIRRLGDIPLCVSAPISVPSNPVVQLQCGAGRGQEWLIRWLPTNIGYRLRSAYNLNQCLTRPAAAQSGTLLFTGACTQVIGEDAPLSQRWIIE
ncbi:MAG TPA: RICIN domain-containing protein [Terriglobales bacterium]|nr:RICIN domain-containing protein [Terriglobales bacterium]